MCDVDIGSVLISFLPTVGSIALIASLASSQDSDAVARSGSFAIATFGLFAYNVFTSVFSVDEPALLSAGGEATMLTDVYDYAVWFDGIVVATAAVTEITERQLAPSVWMPVAGLSALLHLIGVLLGDYSNSAVVIAGLVYLGVLDSVGDAVAGITDALPPALQVRNPPLHKLLALGLLVASAATTSTSLTDMIAEEEVIAIAIATVASVLFLYVEPGTLAARFLAVAGLTAVPVALYYLSDAVGVKGTGLDGGTCVETVANLTTVEIASERVANLQDEELVWYILHLSSGLLLAAGFVMNAASDIGVQVADLTDYVKGAIASVSDGDDDRGHGHTRGHHGHGHGHPRSGPKSNCKPAEGCEDAEIIVPEAIKAGKVAKQPGHAMALP